MYGMNTREPEIDRMKERIKFTVRAPQIDRKKERKRSSPGRKSSTDRQKERKRSSSGRALPLASTVVRLTQSLKLCMGDKVRSPATSPARVLVPVKSC